MKVWVDTDELYPCFYISDYKWGVECDIPQDFLDRWEKADLEWRKCQNMFDDFYTEAKKAKQLEDCKNGIPSKGF